MTHCSNCGELYPEACMTITEAGILCLDCLCDYREAQRRYAASLTFPQRHAEGLDRAGVDRPSDQV